MDTNFMTFCGLRRPGEAVCRNSRNPRFPKGQAGVSAVVHYEACIRRTLVQHVFAVFILAGIQYEEDAAEVA